MKIFKWFTLVVTSLFTLCVIYLLFNFTLDIVRIILLCIVLVWVWFEEIRIWRE
jgi:hypothetical protein